MNLRLVVDVNLSPDWVPVLTGAGFPAVHWTQVDDSSAPDQAIMSWAAANGYTVFSHDLDFSTMLAEFWGQTTITCRTAPNSRRGRRTKTRKIPARLSGAQLFMVRPHLPRPHLPSQFTQALARELLNDWDTFWAVLDHPELRLTNNEAERALRHWVIARRIGMGTRTPQGTRAYALLASVIETCRKRAASPWTYLAELIRDRRQDLPAPLLPMPTT